MTPQKNLRHNNVHKGFGAFAVCCGGIAFVLEVAGIGASPRDGMQFGNGIWMSIFLGLDGLFCILAGVKDSRCCVITGLVFDIIGVIIAIIGLSFASIELSIRVAYDTYSEYDMYYNYNRYDYNRHGEMTFNLAKASIMIIIALVQTILLIVHSAFVCHDCCSCCQPQPPQQQQWVTSVNVTGAQWQPQVQMMNQRGDMTMQAYPMVNATNGQMIMPTQYPITMMQGDQRMMQQAYPMERGYQGYPMQSGYQGYPMQMAQQQYPMASSPHQANQGTPGNAQEGQGSYPVSGGHNDSSIPPPNYASVVPDNPNQDFTKLADVHN